MQTMSGRSERRFDRLFCALLLLFGASCAQGAGSAEPAAPAGATPRAHVLACFAARYEEREHKAAPAADEEARQAAEQLLAKYNGKPKRACGAIQVALSGSLCDLPVTLASVVACERRGRENRADGGLNPEKKEELEQRVRENERRNIDPTQVGF